VVDSGEVAMKSKIIFLILSIGTSLVISLRIFKTDKAFAVALGAGMAVFLIGWGLSHALKKLGPRSAVGLAVGMVIASVAFFAVYSLLPPIAETYNVPLDSPFWKIILPLVFITLYYLGITAGIYVGGDFGAPTKPHHKGKGMVRTKILDTSVIIDGRIADVSEAGFIDGEMIIPKFIIKELQYIADSSDPIKRVRGRRGLDVLKRMQQEIPGVAVTITSHDFPKIKEADLKLVELAKQIDGIVITNDFNLNKVADLEGVKVFNLNELANALKPVVLPGETMSIRVVKAGKEENQGVGYLDDGTMVVVDDAKHYVGKDIDVSVTSVLQTPTGRMIFSKVKPHGARASYQN